MLILSPSPFSLTVAIVSRGAGISIIAGADIHIFVFTDCKNNRFQKKLIGQNTNICPPPPPNYRYSGASDRIKLANVTERPVIP
jgi:hypothetical protein